MDKKVLMNLLARYLITFLAIISIVLIAIISDIRGGMKFQNLVGLIIHFRWVIYLIFIAGIYGCVSNIKKKRYEPLHIPTFLSKICKEPQGQDREIFIKSEELFQKSMVRLLSIVLAASLVVEVIYFLIKSRHGT